MLNRTIIMGRVCGDIELKQTQSGTPVASFSVAVQRDHAPKGESPLTDFFDVVVWRTTAEFAVKHFGKGKGIVVSGRLQTRTWEDKQGNKRKSVEIIADNVYFTFDKSPREREGDGILEQESNPYFDGSATDFVAGDTDFNEFPFN